MVQEEEVDQQSSCWWICHSTGTSNPGATINVGYPGGNYPGPNGAMAGGGGGAGAASGPPFSGAAGPGQRGGIEIQHHQHLETLPALWVLQDLTVKTSGLLVVVVEDMSLLEMVDLEEHTPQDHQRRHLILVLDKVVLVVFSLCIEGR